MEIHINAGESQNISHYNYLWFCQQRATDKDVDVQYLRLFPKAEYEIDLCNILPLKLMERILSMHCSLQFVYSPPSDSNALVVI